MNETEGKAAMVAATERGKRRSFNNKTYEVKRRKVFIKKCEGGLMKTEVASIALSLCLDALELLNVVAR
jgi:hypothetical protein